MSGCDKPANGLSGICIKHTDKGPCQEENCTKPAMCHAKGLLVCAKHYENRMGLKTPREEGWDDKPHKGYIVRYSCGDPAYVGITHNAVQRRMREHSYDSWWYDEDLAIPTEAEAEFENLAAAKKWEKETIHQLVTEGHFLFNFDHNKQQYDAAHNVVLEELADLIS